jgi:hypothetical protein
MSVKCCSSVVCWVLKRVSERGLKESVSYIFSKKLVSEESAHAFDFSSNGFVSELQETFDM